MQKIKIALCDKDKFYCERFAAYMMNHKAQEIELNIYSTIEQFTGDEKMGNFDLVIAGSGFEEFSSDVNIMYLSDLCGNQAAEEARRKLLRNISRWNSCCMKFMCRQG